MEGNVTVLGSLDTKGRRTSEGSGIQFGPRRLPAQGEIQAT